MEHPWGGYFWIAIVGVVMVTALWVVYLEYGFRDRLVAQAQERLQVWSYLEQAQNYDRFECKADRFRDDIVLRKITNDSSPVSLQYTPDDLVTLDDRYTNPQYGAQRVRAMVRDPIERLLNDAWRAGHYILVNSTYRSAEIQQDMYERYGGSAGVDDLGERAALPGFSEHQLGTAVDLSTYPRATDAGYDWLANNAHKYGFVLSYPRGAEEITQYRYEPWHWRYVGSEIAEQIKANEMLFNHEQALFLPSPIEDRTILSYEYEGRDLWIWKYRTGGGTMDVLIRGEVLPTYTQEVPYMLKQFDGGRPPAELAGDYLRTWVIQDYAQYIDEYGKDWQMTRLASFYDDTTIERLLILYRPEIGYVVISYQSQVYGDRLVREFTSSCRVR